MVATQDPPNGKGIIEEGGSGLNVAINGFDISGAQVGDGNGAAIRYDGGNLTLNDDSIHDNQDGLLSAADPNGNITINGSTFADNGTGNGSTHNIYVGDVANLTVQNSTITDAVVGHDIKSRAESTTITGNTITDGATGTASYEIDLPDGGNATITGNIIEKGSNAQNPNAISFGEEGNVHPNSSLTVQGNTLLNDDTAHYTTAVVNDTGVTAAITGNSLYGWSTVASGPASIAGSIALLAEPLLSSLVPGGATSTSSGSAASSGTPSAPSGTDTTTAPPTPAGVTASTGAGTATDSGSAGTGSTTVGSTSTDTGSNGNGAATGAGTAASAPPQGGDNGSVPISTATVGSSSGTPGFAAGGTTDGTGQGSSPAAPLPAIQPGETAPQILEALLQSYGIPVTLAQILGTPAGTDPAGGSAIPSLGSQPGASGAALIASSNPQSAVSQILPAGNG